LCFLIPRKTLRLAGQEHGRAIPLADFKQLDVSRHIVQLLGHDDQRGPRFRISC
jgi:hypothetical protein